MKSEHIDSEEKVSSDRVAPGHVELPHDPDAGLSAADRAQVV